MKKLILLVSLGFVVTFFYTPLLMIIKDAFIYEDKVSFGNFIELFNSPYQRFVVLFTIKQAFISLLFTLVIGIPTAYIFKTYSFPGKSLLKSLVLVPFVLPTIIVALGFILLYGQNGYLNQILRQFNLNLRILYRFEAIILAHSFYNFPIVVKIVGDAWERINPDYHNAAMTLGADRKSVFTRVTLPSLLPALINSSYLVFIYCFMSFGIVLVLGSVRFTTIEVNIYYLINNLFNIPLAMALGVIQILFSLIFLFLSQVIGHKSLRYLNLLEVHKRKSSYNKLFSFSARKPLSVITKLVSLLFLLLIILIIIGPMAAILIQGVERNLSENIALVSLFQNASSYNQIIGASINQVITNSGRLALLVACSTLLLSLLIAQGVTHLELTGKKKTAALCEFSVIVPLFISPITLTLGYLRLVTVNNWGIDRFSLVAIAQTLLALPFAVRIILQALRNMPQNQIKAAQLLGADNLRVYLHLIIPQMKNSLILAFSFAFAISLGEFGSVLMLNRSYVTIPIAIYRFIGARRLTDGINLAIMLILFTFLFFFLVERLSNPKELKVEE